MSDALLAFHFIRPYALLLVAPALVLWLIGSRASDTIRQWQAVIDAELLPHLLVGGAESRRFSPLTLMLAAWLLGILAAAGPTWEREPSPFADAKPPVVIVLRVTPSMRQVDLAPTRMERATQKLSDILGLREGASTGLVAYAGSAHLVLPPTEDREVVIAMAKALAPDIMPRPGNDLPDALALARRMLADGGRGGSVLVMADAVADDELERLTKTGGSDQTAPVTILATIPPERIAGTLRRAAAAIDADLVEATSDQADVNAIVSRLDRAGQIRDVVGVGQHWKEFGYWLMPAIAGLTLLWFRRGWVLP